MAIKPVKPTVPPAPSRANPGTDFATKADAFVAFQAPFADYMDAVADFTDERADAALAAALGGTLPALTGKALNMTRVNAGATALEFRTPAQVLADLGVTATAAELNHVDGVTSPIQPQLNGKSPLPQSAAGVGEWRSLIAANGVALVLPAGGTWAYIYTFFNTSGQWVSAVASVAAGGSTISGTNDVKSGCGWRIA